MKTMMIKTLLISSLIVSNSFASDTVSLNKNDPAPFSGILMTTQKAQLIKTQLLERDTLLQEKDSFEKSLKLYSDITLLNNQKINLLSTENDRLSKELKDSSNTTNWERALYFSLGVLATGLVIYGARQTLK